MDRDKEKLSKERPQEHAEWVAGRDHLTGLSSLHQFASRAFAQLVTMDPARAEETVIVFLNFHHFKQYNRKFGYEEGDLVLCRFADALSSSEKIDLASRISEDHFLFLSEKSAVENVLRELNRLLKSMSGAGKLELQAGIYDIKPMESVISAGDKAKAAAESLRGKVVGDVFWRYYDRDLELAVERRSYIVENIDRAIESGWIQVYYQPVVRTLTGKLCGMEALARWEDPAYGMMPPGLFISVLEDNLMIHKLDLEIVRLVCKDYRRETDAHRNFVPVSFNLSRLDFELCDILEEVEQIVAQYEVPKDMIHVEVTESSLSGDDRHLKKVMNQFHERGYQVWMDDFGSGYSTLNVLKDYEFDEIKIDMRFLSDTGERSLKIITSVVDMAKKIGIQTLAEGVETKEQLDFLNSIGCEKIQGYYYGKPDRLAAGAGRFLTDDDRVEMEEERHYYDAVGRINLIDDRAISLTEYDGTSFRVCYMNDALAEILRSRGIMDKESLQAVFNDPCFIARKALVEVSEIATTVNGRHGVQFSIAGCFYQLLVDCIAENDSRKMFLVGVSNITEGAGVNRSESRFMEPAENGI